MRDSGYERNENDFYQEPPWATDALLAAERPFLGKVMDPCCGGGNIVLQIMRHKGVAVFGSDIVQRGTLQAYTLPFQASIVQLKPDSIVSNPPYNQAQEFIDCALEHTTDRVCVLLRLAFLEGQKRRDWFKNVPLARVWVSSKRMSMPPGGTDVKAKGGAIAYAWFVFEKGYQGAPVIGWLPDVKEVKGG